MSSIGEPAWHTLHRQLGLACHSRKPDNTCVLDMFCESRLPLRRTAHAHNWAQGQQMKPAAAARWQSLF